ncbi:hypothetical protein [Psychromonas hadalis]|uniref:hypothetical protein n=1 Tax=Psychromonas hadalis TaxID=211669 RepID=UPI0003B38FE8|nr:hypothetical protein [Psychromonas hadalis]
MDNIAHEYDKFGPWLLQVKSIQDIPHQYFEHQDTILAAKYCFKIPIKEDRRALHAGMLLYNKLIIIDEQRIVEFSVVNDQIITHELLFKDVQYLIHQGDLLNCEICLISQKNSLNFQYNLVSMDIAGDVMHLLRESINVVEQSSARPDILSQKHSELQIFSYFCITEKENQSLQILNYQAGLALGLLASNQLFQSLTKYQLLDSMFMTNGVELIIANRGKYVVQENETNYKFGHTFIPLKHITNISQQHDEMFKTIKQINIELGGQLLQASVDKDFVIDSLENLLVTD